MYLNIPLEVLSDAHFVSNFEIRGGNLPASSHALRDEKIRLETKATK